MKIRVEISMEHNQFGKLNYYQEREVFNDSRETGLMHIIVSMASFIGTKLLMGYGYGLRQGKFDETLTDVSKLAPTEGERPSRKKPVDNERHG